MFWFAALVVLALSSILLLLVHVSRHYRDYDESMPDLDGL